MEDDVTIGAGIEERLVIGDVAVSELNIWKARDVAGRSDEGPDCVALAQEGVAQSSSNVAGSASDQYLHSVSLSVVCRWSMVGVLANAL